MVNNPQEAQSHSLQRQHKVHSTQTIPDYLGIQLQLMARHLSSFEVFLTSQRPAWQSCERVKGTGKGEKLENSGEQGPSLLSSAHRYVSCFALQGLQRLEELVRKVVDLVDNRVESNMKAISNTMLVDLPSDRSFTYEEFISSQAKFQQKQAEILAVRNEEVG